MKIILGKTLCQVIKKSSEDQRGKERVINSGIIFDACYDQKGEINFVRVYNHLLKPNQGSYQSLREWYAVESKNSWIVITGELERKNSIDIKKLLGNNL